jgi:carbon-monoxide dehydrogenase iron sulfur subunit
MKEASGSVLVVDADKCTGCQVCELVCSMAKHGEYNPKKSYIRVMRNREMSVDIVACSVRCDYCGKCVKWCLPGALRILSLAEAAVVRKQNRIGIFPVPLIAEDMK